MVWNPQGTDHGLSVSFSTEYKGVKEFFHYSVWRFKLLMTKESANHITLEHGSGGMLTMALIKDMILGHLKNQYLESLDDSAELPLPSSGRLAFTLDSYVVDPIFFPGGDIGSLSVYGSINDLSMQGAVPLYLALGLILEEGFHKEALAKIIASISHASKKAGVLVVTGDTKVVKKGQADKIFVTTAGVGFIPEGRNTAIDNARAGDLILINGGVGDHGIAIMMARQELGISSHIQTDSQPLNLLLEHLGDLMQHVHVLKDPTRGGLATSLNEIAEASGVGIVLEESSIPIKQEVLQISDLLGLDPLYLANEGKMVMAVERGWAEKVLQRMREHPFGLDASIIGEVLEEPKGKVIMRTRIGGKRILPVMRGVQLPRIC